ncbi:MAG: FtsX-like permease family protein [Planctomycetes bacterium]|nr:FtsX-like permease family protein [Planctomycetota bacterium]
MSHLKLIRRNALRKPLRAILTFAAVCIAMFVFGLVFTFIDLLTAGAEELEKAPVIWVRHKISLMFPVPEKYEEQIQAIPGVATCAPMMWTEGAYKDPSIYFPQFGTDPNDVFDGFAGVTTDPGQLAEFQRDLTGCAAGKALADRCGWRVGDRIYLGRRLWPVDLDLTLRCIYTSTKTDDEGMLLYNIKALQEGFLKKTGHRYDTVGTYRVGVETLDQVPAVIEAIDGKFADHDFPTKSEPEAAFIRSFISMWGDVPGIARFVGTVIIIFLVLICGNSLAMVMRERVREVAVLKTLGFSSARILTVLVAEALLVSTLGGLCGLGASVWVAGSGLFDMFMPGASMRMETILLSAAAAVGIGLVAGVGPAWLAVRAPIVDGLRRVS